LTVPRIFFFRPGNRDISRIGIWRIPSAVLNAGSCVGRGFPVMERGLLMVNGDTGISIAPSEMGREANWADASLEEVFEAHQQQERRRSEEMTPVGEAAARVHVRVAPNELASSLDTIARRLRTRRSVLTKCLSHQVIDWYKNSLNINGLTEEFDDIYHKIKVTGRYSPLRKQIDLPNFRFVSEEIIDTTVVSINWVMGDLADMGRPIGASAASLLWVGLARSMTMLEHRNWDKGNIERYFEPEARNMEICVADRFIDIDGLRKKYEMREGRNDL